MRATLVDADLVEMLDALPTRALHLVADELADLADTASDDTRAVLLHVVAVADALAGGSR